ncbi:MAG TPA: hypothetical protein VMG12_34825 [Polyangiaceae bacterium]|nr:hypothetical protein [Polyangiaceae bacterium]
MSRFVRRLGVASLVGASVACTEAVRLGRDVPGAGGLAAGAAGVASAGSAGDGFPLGGAGGSAGAAPVIVDAGPCTPLPCGNTTRACGDCEDNDGDGWPDASDPECLGPCDDSEDELFNGTAVNVTGSCRADCYFSFDRNSGSGDDGCSWSYRCDPGSLAPDYPPTERSMCEYDDALALCDPAGPALAACQTNCLPLTPNGCDCFGCCELPAGSGSFIWLGSGLERGECELSTSTDPSLCRPCTPVAGCQNPCEECELCVGKPELPATCGGAAVPACPGSLRSCDPRSSVGCGPLEYCITGCCVPLPS